MFLKRLVIQSKEGIIRDISFQKGLNLIVDESNKLERKETGNNIGKTTILRLVDFCFGSDGKNIYMDGEFKKQPNTLIKNFLEDRQVLITVELWENLENEESRKVIIRRNFLKRKAKIQEVNGESIPNTKDFDRKLKEVIFGFTEEKPTFKQIVSKNIRDEQNKMTNIVKVLNSFTKVEEYEALYLFWLGVQTDQHHDKEMVLAEIRKEENFQKRLKDEGELSLINQQLIFVDSKIEKLSEQKKNFKLNPNYEKDIDRLNQVKRKLNQLSNEKSRLIIRKDLIQESKKELEGEVSNIDNSQIAILYQKAKSFIPNIQVSFEQTLKFHNDLIAQKLEYITQELPDIKTEMEQLSKQIASLRKQEVELTQKLEKLGLLEDLEIIIKDLNNYYENKGKLEELRRFWNKSNQHLEDLKEELGEINKKINQKDQVIQDRITLFNTYFSEISNILYGEHYLLSSKKDEKAYRLVVTNIEGNPSTGKKKGQIAAFDFAYIQFADKVGIESLHFVMHDQIETIHSNQLKTIVEVATSLNGQYIVPILKDKIPNDINTSSYEIIALSQDNKLFKI